MNKDILIIVFEGENDKNFFETYVRKKIYCRGYINDDNYIPIILNGCRSKDKSKDIRKTIYNYNYSLNISELSKIILDHIKW